MHGVQPTNILRSKSADDISDGKSDGWFAHACGQMGVKGLVLHVLTGFRERDCERYAAGSVKPPAYFLRALLRSEEGWIWLEVAMDNSEAKWWQDIKRARRIAEALNHE